MFSIFRLKMQPTSRVGGFEVGSPTIEPTDVFCGLASLIVEGRMPKNDRRGYGEGPHVPPPVTKPLSSASRHECSEENNLVSNMPPTILDMHDGQSCWLPYYRRLVLPRYRLR